MKKLLAVISSIAVCGSAVAVSVLSYFPSPVKVGATAPDTTSLVTTTLSDSGTFPTITFSRGTLLNATGDITVRIYLCPTGWRTDDSFYVSPSSYGNYSTANGYMEIYFEWYHFDSHFVVGSYCNFGDRLAGKKLFSSLLLSDINGVACIPTHRIDFKATAPNNNTVFRVMSWWLPFTPFSRDGLPLDFVCSLTGIIGNDYDLWHSSIAYQGGYDDGNADGYDNGYSSGYSVGVHDGSSQFGMWDLFSNAFGSVGNILGIQIFPGFTVGLLISVPIAFAFILWLIHVLKG